MTKICLDISTVCPAKCRYCLHQYKGMVRQRIMSLPTFEKIHAILLAEGFNHVCPFMSGEPTTHPYFWNIIEALSVSGIRTHTDTKLPITMDAESIDRVLSIKNRALIHFEVCVDAASQDTQNKISIGKMNTERIYRNLKMLGDAAKKYSGVSILVLTVINKFNEAELPEIKRRVLSSGVRQWAAKHMGFYMSNNMDEEDKKNLSDLMPKAGTRRFSLINGVVRGKVGCQYLMPAISPEGNVTICCHDMLYQQVVGNVLESGSLLSILKSKRYINTVRSGKKMALPICKGCN